MNFYSKNLKNCKKGPREIAFNTLPWNLKLCCPQKLRGRKAFRVGRCFPNDTNQNETLPGPGFASWECC